MLCGRCNERGLFFKSLVLVILLLLLQVINTCWELNRCGQLLEHATECSPRHGLIVRVDCFHCLILLFKGYVCLFPNKTNHLHHLIIYFFYAQIINDEDGGMHRRHASPVVRERTPQTSSHNNSTSTLSGYGTSAIVAMDRNASLPSAPSPSLSSSLFSSQPKSMSKAPERSLESVLHASKQKVTAIESMLRGLDSGRVRSSSLDLGISFDSNHHPSSF